MAGFFENIRTALSNWWSGPSLPNYPKEQPIANRYGLKLGEFLVEGNHLTIRQYEDLRHIREISRLHNYDDLGSQLAELEDAIEDARRIGPFRNKAYRQASSALQSLLVERLDREIAEMQEKGITADDAAYSNQVLLREYYMQHPEVFEWLVEKHQDLLEDVAEDRRAMHLPDLAINSGLISENKEESRAIVEGALAAKHLNRVETLKQAIHSQQEIIQQEAASRSYLEYIGFPRSVTELTLAPEDVHYTSDNSDLAKIQSLRALYTGLIHSQRNAFLPPEDMVAHLGQLEQLGELVQLGMLAVVGDAPEAAYQQAIETLSYAWSAHLASIEEMAESQAIRPLVKFLADAQSISDEAAQEQLTNGIDAFREQQEKMAAEAAATETDVQTEPANSAADTLTDTAVEESPIASEATTDAANADLDQEAAGDTAVTATTDISSSIEQPAEAVAGEGRPSGDGELAESSEITAMAGGEGALPDAVPEKEPVAQPA